MYRKIVYTLIISMSIFVIFIRAIDKKNNEFIDVINIHKDNKFKFLKKNSKIVLNNEEFFPIGCYRDPDDQLLNISNIIDGGFNLTHSYEFEHGTAKIKEAKEYLELCERNDLKVFMGINRKKIQNRDFEWIINWIGELKNFSSLFSWYLYDEPKLHNVQPELLIKLNKTIKSIDSINFTSTVLFYPQTSKDYFDAYDILMIDEYPIPNRNIKNVYTKIKDANKIINGTKPVIAVLQAHDKNGKEKVRQGKEIIRPTFNEIRCMTYLAIAAGSDGIIYYWSPNSKYHLINQAPKVWYGLVRVVKELNKIKPYLLSDKKDYYHFDKENNIALWSSSYKNKILLSIINTSSKIINININLKKIEFSELINTDSLSTFNYENRIIEAKFKPYEVKLYYLL